MSSGRASQWERGSRAIYSQAQLSRTQADWLLQTCGLVTEDVMAKFDEWRTRSIRFHHPPQCTLWGGIFTRLDDLDGNSFVLVGLDDFVREIEAQRSCGEAGGQTPQRPGIGNYKTGAGKAVPPNAAAAQNARILGCLPSGA